VSILLFLGLFVIDLGPRPDVRDRQTSNRRQTSLNAPPPIRVGA